jgi:hypothetical protein
MKKLSPLFIILLIRINMNKFLFTLFITVTLLMARNTPITAQPIPVAPSVGEPLPEWEYGTTNIAYEVESIANLLWIAAPNSLVPNPPQEERLRRFYYQTKDINATETQYWYPDGLGGYKGFIPIGGPDAGIKYYDGRGFGICNLYINRPEMDYVGLFGCKGGTLYCDILNLGVSNVNITGRNYVGGLIGKSSGSIITSFSTGSVSGQNHVGGLVGNGEGGWITNSYSTASVNGNTNVGGLVGWNDNVQIKNDYAAGSVNGIGSQIGGLIGFTSGTANIINSFWDIQTSGQSTSSGGSGKNTDEMKLQTTFTDADWDFTPNDGKWLIIESNNKISYPYLQGFIYHTPAPAPLPILFFPGLEFLIPNGNGSPENPYQIANLENLHWLSSAYDEWDKNFIQIANIDASATSTWDDGGGFWAIGDFDHKSFTGNYDGDGHTIFSLTCNHPTWANTGLFGIVDGSEIKDLTLSNLSILGCTCTGGLVGKASNATLSNVEVSGVVTGNDLTGGLFGEAFGCTISGCSSSANVTGNDYFTGGLIGYSDANDISTSNCTAVFVSGISNNTGGFIGKSQNSQIVNCYSTAVVNGREDNVGGFIGCNLGVSAEVSKCYSTGNVTATVNEFSDNKNVGGFIGETEGLIENCYSKGNVSTTGDEIPEVGVFIANVVGGASVQYCYTTGDYTTAVGNYGFIFVNNGTAVHNFYDSELSSQNSGTGATGKTTAEMKTLSPFTDANWDFTDVWAITSSYNNGYPNLNHQYEYLWDGSESGDWNTAGNWNLGSVPTIIGHIIIPADAICNPIISSSISASCNNLTIESGASLTIESDATGTASLIINGILSNNGTITSQRYFPGASSLNWHMISAPVASMGIASSGFAPTTGDFYAWDEANPGTWVNYKNTTVAPTFNTVNGGDNFIVAKGYLLAFNEANPTKTFTGTINVGSHAFVLKNSSSKDWNYNSGWNLLGNPYSSAIDWNDADRNLFLDEFAYAYNPQANEGAGAYVPIDGSSENAYIASNQGFFVHAAVAANNQPFTFTSNLQTHGGNYFKNTAENDKLVLRLTGEMYYDETTIRQLDESTFNKDRVDAFKMNSYNVNAPNVYSISNDNVNLSINSIPHIGTENNIRIGFTAPKNGLYKIKVVKASNYMMNNNIYLEDQLLNKWHKISESEYSFSSDAGDIADRFVIHFGVVGLEEITPSNDLIQLWTNHSIINLYNPENITGEIMVYNIMGQIVVQTKLNANMNQQIKLLAPSGYYIVNIVNNKQIINKKVFLR